MLSKEELDRLDVAGAQLVGATEATMAERPGSIEDEERPEGDGEPARSSRAARVLADRERWRLVRPPRRSDAVLDALQEMIVSRELRPGDRLPTERDLAELFGVGRNSVREAIRQLALLGLVEAYQGGGTFVLESSADSLVRPFRNLVQVGGTTADKVMEFRLIFEPTVAALAALRRDERSLAALEEALADFEEAMRGGRDDAAAHDTRFHHLVAEATGNPVVAAVEGALMELLHAFRKQALERAGYEPGERVTHGHREVLDHIRGGDAGGAAESIRRHLEAALAHVRPEADVHAVQDG